MGDNHFGAGPLPSNFNQLVNLTSLTIYSTNHTQFPTVVNTIPSLKSYDHGFSNALTGWGNLATLVNLDTLSIPGGINLTPVLPAYLSSLTKLKTLALRRFGTTPSNKLDTLINNLYDFVSTNAAMTGANSLPFRGMNINVSVISIGDATQTPSGINQQPAGYVQGISNGTPATPKEKIWVMVNQYGHIWITK
ncbi:hypothetical protein [Solitalea lacus]|uniref:hypothetical protein n=1 Tax=Solitalea lacus TaxID=2911172 RepID=UPI001EDC3E50|nr:hypothetical protein [Solitalea lacus]UKJ09070.1 hypothetical protein L2B55_07860 [Solitalea lacus]